MQIARILIVDDDDLLARTMARELRPMCQVVEIAMTCATALAQLDRRPDLVLVDVRLPDGSGIDVVQKARTLTPKPRIIGLSAQANAAEGFALAREGACTFLSKPFSLESLLPTIHHALSMPMELGGQIEDNVGFVNFETVHERVKSRMIQQALGLSKSNISGAAKLLGVSRQRLQQWIRAFQIKIHDHNPIHDDDVNEVLRRRIRPETFHLI